jgi:hypothetical protein
MHELQFAFSLPDVKGGEPLPDFYFLVLKFLNYLTSGFAGFVSSKETFVSYIEMSTL